MVVRMRHTKGHTANRRSHHALTKPGVATDKETGSVHLRHRVDMKTGMYRGTQVISRGTKAAPAKKTAAKKKAAKS